MTFLQDVLDLQKELEAEGDSLDGGDLNYNLDNVQLISDKITARGRWALYHESIYKRGGEYIGESWGEPATEMQEYDEPPEFYAVEPYFEVITKFRTVK